MTVTELKARIAQTLHRPDMATQIPNFISDAQERINRRFGVALAVPADADPLPDGTGLLYFYAAMQGANEFLNNGDNARYYSELWELEADRQNVLNPGTVTDSYATEPPFIIGESQL